MAKTTPQEIPELNTSVDAAAWDDAHVYVHCHCHRNDEGFGIRVWKSTFLIDTGSGLRSTLVHAENISYAPQWTIVQPDQSYSFLLIFNGLPAGCQLFDFIEEIPQPGGFRVKNIRRNEKDVYHIDVM